MELDLYLHTALDIIRFTLVAFAKFFRDKIEFRALNRYNKVIVVGDYERDIILPPGFKSTGRFFHVG